jgi:hypothetical protein
MRQAFKGMLANQTEMKWFEKTATGTTAAAGVCDVVTQSIVQGDADNQRTADKIHVKKLELRATLISGAAQAVPVYVRYILFRANFDIASVPAVTDLLQAATVTSAYTIRQMQVHRYKILLDRTFALGPRVTELTGVPSAIPFQQVYKLDTEVHYNDTTDAAGANGKGAYFYIILTSAAANQPTYALDHMVGFTDI